MLLYFQNTIIVFITVWCILIILIGFILFCVSIKKLSTSNTMETNTISLNHENHHSNKLKDINNNWSSTNYELTEQDDYLKGCINDELKTRIMIDHLKYLRELHAAAERCFIKKNAFKCIQIITYCPYLINAKYGIDGRTAFHQVCSHRHVALMSFMLSKGADPWLETSHNETALCIVIHASLKNVSESSLTIVCLKLLEEYGCYVDFTNDWYQEYLRAAMITNNLTLVKWMLDNTATYRHLSRTSSLPLLITPKS